MTEAAAQHSWYRDQDRLLAELRGVHAAESPTPVIAGYRDLREIGRGGQGTVYRGQQQSTGQNVAIKVLREPQPDPEDRARFLREVEVVASLAHPGIVKVLHRGEAADGRLYIVMELVEGLPFDEYAREQDVDTIVRQVVEIAEAVQHAHQRGVIHRDLKPSNVRIDAHDRPHLLDFGLAKPMGGAIATELVSRTGLFLGSLPWASPEQLGGDANAVDARTDVYALGVMLYEALCGKTPYPTDGGIGATIQHVTTTNPQRPKREGNALPTDLTAIVLHCLEKEPSRRYQSASELAQDLRRFLAQQPISARTPSLSYVAQTWMRRHRGVSAALALLLVGALAGGAGLWFLYGRSVQSEADARLAADKFAAVNEYLLGTILSDPDDAERKVAEAVRAAAAGVDDNPGLENPLFRAEAHNAVAYWLSSIGDKRAAWEHHEQAMQLRQPLVDPKHPDMTIHYTTLAYFRELHEDYAGAIELMERALDNLTRDTTVPESTRAWILRVIGESRLGLGEWGAAEAVLSESLAIEQRIRAPDARQIEECQALLAKIAEQRKLTRPPR